MKSENQNFIQEGYVEIFSEKSSSNVLEFELPSKWLRNKIVGIEIKDFISGLLSTESDKELHIVAAYYDNAEHIFKPHHSSAQSTKFEKLAISLFDSNKGRHTIHSLLGIGYPSNNVYKKLNDKIRLKFFYEDGTAVNFHSVPYYIRFAVHFGPKTKII